MIPNLDVSTLRTGYQLRQQASFDALGAKLGLAIDVIEMTRALRIVHERDLHTMLPVLVEQLVVARTTEHNYGFHHVVQPGCRVYTCLVVCDGDRVVASVQPSVRGNPLPDPGWTIRGWDPDEPARTAKAIVAWARDPARRHDAGEFRIEKPFPTPDTGDVRADLHALELAIGARALRDPERAALRARYTRLLDEHRSLIVGDLARIVDTSVTRHGLVDGIAIRAGIVDGIAVRASRLASTSDALALLGRAPPRRVCILVDRERAWNQIATSGVLGQIRDLELTGLQRHPAFKLLDVAIERLASVPLHATERLALTWLRTTDDTWADLLPALHAPRLRALCIDHAGLGPAGAACLASPNLLPGIVDVALTDLRSEHVRAIGMRSGLRTLSLGSLSSGSEPAIADVLAHAELTAFAIDDQHVTDAILEPLALALARRPFERVALDSHAFTPAGIAQLIRSPGFGQLAQFALRVPWDATVLADAILATNARTRFELRDARSLPAAVRAHVELATTRLDGSIDADG